MSGGVASPVQVTASAEIYTPITQGLQTSQTGLTFRVAAGSYSTSPQTVAVLSATATIPWTLSTNTYQGGGWLSATPTSGTGAPGSAPTTITINVNPGGLTAQDYYGAVTLTPTDGKHPPVSIAIVLSIVPAGSPAAPVVSPTGLVFLGTTGASVLPQTFHISNLTSSVLKYTATASATTNWFSLSLTSSSIIAAATQSITVTPSIGNLNPGVYPGSVLLTFGDGSTQTVALLLVVSAAPGTSSSAVIRAHAASMACVPSKLLPVLTSVGSGFTTPTAWPTAIQVQVVDDCGNSINTGSVTVSFSNGDSPVALLAIGSGNWAGTWVPVHSTAGLTIRADAQSSRLVGSVSVSGQVTSNPNAPVVSAGGVVSAVDYKSSPALGLLVTIFGSGLADGSAGLTGLPAPTQLGSTSVLLSGSPLPLLYVSDSQVNAIIPYTVQSNASHQLVVSRGSAYSVPVDVAVFNSEPAIVSVDGSGNGQGQIYWVDAHGNSGLANANAPASAGEALVILAVGLGAVSPSLTAGTGAPSSPPANTAVPVTVTIGGVSASVFFSGLTPGFVGLYQVNATVPIGVMPGSQVPVTVSVAGRSNSGNIYMAVQ